jgi:hypothetical protein
MSALKSEIWVFAFLRRCQNQGHYGAVIHRGASEAGAIYIYVNHLDGTYDLLGPPPGPAHNELGERRFTREFPEPCGWELVSAAISRRRKIDSDIWAIEIEDRTGFAGIVPENL